MLESENDRVKIPAAVRWLGRPSGVKARYAEGTIEVSSITLPVMGEASFGRLQKSGLRLLGHRYSVEAFEEEQPDMHCGRCARWGHIQVRCNRNTRCALCAQEHHTDRHRCPVEEQGQGVRTSLPSLLTAVASTSRMRTCAWRSERRVKL